MLFRSRAFRDPAVLRELVAALSDVHEAARAEPWSLDDAPADYVEGMLRGIVGLEITVDRIEAAWKMSQNKRGEDLRGVLRGAAAEGASLSQGLRAVHGPADP